MEWVKFLHFILEVCDWWLVLICCERKVLLAGWWLVLIWCERKALLLLVASRTGTRHFQIVAQRTRQSKHFQTVPLRTRQSKHLP